MAARVWMIKQGHVSDVAGSTPLITEGATDLGTGYLMVGLRDITKGKVDEIVLSLQGLIAHLLSDRSQIPPHV